MATTIFSNTLIKPSTGSTRPLRILGIAGSLRHGSYNRAALRAAAELLPPDTELDIFDLAGIPVFNQDDENRLPDAVAEMKQHIRAADALLISTAEYNASVPGVLKNALDWGSRPPGDNTWSGKPAAIVGASPGSLGTVRAQYHLRQIFVHLNLFPLNQPEVMIADAAHRFDSSGRLTHEPTREFIRQLLQRLVAWTVLIKSEAEK